MSSYTRTHGANARAQSWDDLFEDAPQRDKTGSWLPLDALEDEVFAPGPQLRAMPATRRGPLQPHDIPTEPHGATPRHATQPQARAATRAEAVPQTVTVTGLQAKAVAIVAGAALTLAAAYVVVSMAVQWAQVKLDDMQYGRPRTTQMDAYVGHNEAGGVPSHFIALNLNRRVTIVELPGGDSAKAAAIVGPYLFGEGEDLTPVQATAQDVNGDGKVDLLVNVKSEQLIYLNDGTTFKLATPDEQAAIQKLAAQQAAKGATAPASQPIPAGPLLEGGK